MSGHYLPLATIAWGLSLYYLMGNLDALGKYDGLLGLKSLSIGSLDIGQGRCFFVLIWVILLAGAMALSEPARFAPRARHPVAQGRLADGRGHGHQHLPLQGHHLRDRGVAGFRLGLAVRALPAHGQPSPFGLKMGIEYLFMAVLGGVGYVWGAIVGAGLIKLLDDQLQVLLPALIGTSGSYEVIVFGIAAGAGAEVPARRPVVAGRPLPAERRRAGSTGTTPRHLPSAQQAGHEASWC